MSRLLGLMLLLLVGLGPEIASAQTASKPQSPDVATGASHVAVKASSPLALDPRLRDEALLLYEVQLDQLSLTDTIATYKTIDGPLIPLGELTRLLDADVAVSPEQGRISGTVSEGRWPILVDVESRLVRVKGASSALQPEDLAVGLSDIYVRAALLERILPVRVTIDDRGLRIQIKALEPFPIQSRLDRLGRIRSLRPDIAGQDEVLQATAPYRAITPPAFDVSLATAIDTRAPKFLRRYDIRTAADVLFTGFQGYLGSDNRGAPATARATFERHDPNGMFGPLNVTRASLGDVFTPSLAMGLRSSGGRGIALTTAPLEQASTFERIDLRGELPSGYDIELYVNDILRSGQQTPVRGRYEFLNVPLVRGTNVIRLVTYGLRGERTEEVRVINVGNGQLPKGNFAFEFGATQQDTDVIDLHDDAGLFSGPGRGRPRIAASFGYGLTRGLTVTGGAGSYSPNGLGQRELLTVGLRTSLLGFATQLDASHDSLGGKGFGLALAGRPLGVALIARHSEYRNGFVDETIPSGGDGRALARYSDVTVDLTGRLFGQRTIPIAASVQRSEFANRDTDMRGTLRASSVIGSALFSAGIDYGRVAPRNGPASKQLTGNLAASSFKGLSWQMRANIDYVLLPSAKMRSVNLTADRRIGSNVALRVGLGHSFQSDRNYNAQGSAIFRLPFGDVSLDGNYEPRRKDWCIGLSLTFGLIFDPFKRRYDMRRIGAADGGSLALQAFVDRNGNGYRDSGEVPVPGIGVGGGFTRVTTDDKGQALVTGLGNAASARVQTNMDDIDLPHLSMPPTMIKVFPRPGRTAVVMYPLKPEGEVFLRILAHRADKLVGLSALRLKAVSDTGVAIQKTTEYDGSVYFEHLTGGKYHIELDEDQVRRLNMRLVKPIVFVVPPEGGVLPDINAKLIFDVGAQ